MCGWCWLAPCVAHLKIKSLTVCLQSDSFKQLLPCQSFEDPVQKNLQINLVLSNDGFPYLARALRTRYSSVSFISLPSDGSWLRAGVVALPSGNHKHHFLVVLRLVIVISCWWLWCEEFKYHFIIVLRWQEPLNCDSVIGHRHWCWWLWCEDDEDDYDCNFKNHFLIVREAPHKDNACSNGILPNSFSTSPQANGRFVAGIFRRKLANSLKQRFWIWEWTFWQ